MTLKKSEGRVRAALMRGEKHRWILTLMQRRVVPGEMMSAFAVSVNRDVPVLGE